MVRTVASRRIADVRRMMACACCAALLAVVVPATASAERNNDRVFKGIALSLVPTGDEHKKKKRVAAKEIEKKQAYQIDPTQRVIIEPAAQVPGIDVVDGVQVPKDITATDDPGSVPGDLVETTEDPLDGVNR